MFVSFLNLLKLFLLTQILPLIIGYVALLLLHGSVARGGVTTLAVWHVRLQRYLRYQGLILEIVRYGFVLIAFLLIIDRFEIVFLLTS